MIRHRTNKAGVVANGLLLIASLVACTEAVPARLQHARLDSIPTDSFPNLTQQLSEQGGYFDTDNLISNESSYLHVMDDLREVRIQGGAYIGVGPGQNFSYIAAVRPDVAFIVDIRRDNLLQHLLYKALFALSPHRIDFLGALVGRDVDSVGDASTGWPIDAIVAEVDRAALLPDTAARLVDAVRDQIRTYGVSLTVDDYRTIERFHRAFIRDGLDLRFNSFGRAPRPYYPTLRALLLERDLSGNRSSYLANENDYQFVRELQNRNLVVPVVGNLAGPHALAAIGEWLKDRGLLVSVFYTSNVEYYLWGDGSFPRFAATVVTLPRNARSLLIRSYFRSRFRPHPRAVPGYASTQLVQSMDEFVGEWQEGRYRTYWDLVWER